MAPKHKAKKKNKGPKGKRARAKAKLDRQWGERVVIENDEKDAKKKKTSRVRAETVETTSQDPPIEQHQHQQHVSSVTDDYKYEEKYRQDDIDSDSASDEASLDEDDDGNKAFSTLLANIRKKTVRSQQKQTGAESDEDADDNITSKDDDNLKHDDAMLDGDGSDPDDGVDALPPSVDPFSSRFSQSPLPEDAQQLTQQLAAIQATKKLPYCDQQLCVDISQTGLQLHSWSEHCQRAKSLFVCNREILKRQWKLSINGRRLFDSVQSLLYPVVANYADLLYTSADTREKCKSVERIMLLHILNHVLTSRGRIHRHNRRIKEEQDDDNEEVWRDQGFTRPTVLILLPTRACCHDLVYNMASLLGDGASSVVDNLDRFESEYGPPDNNVADAEMDEAQQRRRQKVLREKGSEWLELFGDDVNDDDDFKIGLALNPKGSSSSKSSKRCSSAGKDSCAIKLFTDFYKSDIILASPLGLKMATTSKDSDDELEADFLSSIEICLVLRGDVLLMQNWDHVNDILSLLNKQPKNTNETDFSRVRHYALAGQAAHWCQLIVTSSLLDPLILSSFKRHAKSIAGLARIRRRYSAQDASISKVVLPVRQVFQRVAATSFAMQSQDRLKYFVDKILPQILRQKQKHTLIFIPSYFDFVSVRNILLKKEVDFVSVTEYARTSEIGRGRARFLQGRKPIMLYTGRAHFFHRHAIKGIRHVIFFGVPEHSNFYSDHVNLLNEGLDQQQQEAEAAVESCLTLYSKYDSHALERIVGSSNCSRMVKGEKSTFIFAS